MSLENLVKIKQLQHHTTNPHEIARLLASARASLADAGNETLSDASRFDLAYKAITRAIRSNRVRCKPVLSTHRCSWHGR